MQKQLQEPNVLERDDLKSFGNATGPCVSLYFADHDPGEKTHQDVVRLRNAIDGAEKRLQALEFDKKAIAELLDPVRALADDLGTWHMEGNAFAVFRSPGVFRVFRPMDRVPELSVVAEHFYILPVLNMLNAQRHFFVLGLSQKRIRLLRCTDHTSEEIALPESLPRSLDQWLNSRLPTESAGHEAALGEGGPTGSFTSTTDRDRRDEFLANYYRVVDKFLADLLRNETAPLVLAGVEYEVAMFTRIASYPRVAQQAVFGSAEGLNGRELHTRALEAARAYWREPMEKALVQYNEGGPDRRCAGADRTARASYEGRVAHLFVAEGGRAMGSFNPDTLEVKLDGDGSLHSEDLLNFAALQTILHAGEVWVMPADRVPGRAQVAAVLRY